MREPSPRRNRELETRSAGEECGGDYEHDHLVLAGMAGGPFRARGVGLSRPAARSALGAPTTRGGWPRFPEYVVARRYAVSGTAPSRSVRVARPTVPTILLPLKLTVKGAPPARRCSAPQTLER
jgi:hypothetical protein